ncbi:tRNA (N6-isopentenyl adenosine(37)-C2)-methylthiotransferase MiaB [Isoptericola sp. NPDC057653]|uniref:tRNA (N6-isopentenyl adenosine(37)-C2)-methylthiotransferase MiaB n=1 Tax=Isoptericola sp. NPDC057653 TaxID=3346195 RepID=UPI0036743F34
MSSTTQSPAAPVRTTDEAPGRRTYLVRTLGCQMNVHDSEHMAGMLEQAGYARATAEDEAASRADVVVINTCAVRENAATRLYGNLGQLAGIKADRPGMQIAVGGCLAQKDRGEIVSKAPWVDVVFGTHNLDALPVLLERARHNAEAQVEIAESLQVFPSTLPTRRESVYAGWVSISVGCNNTCTFCIVPHLRGKERDRRPGEVLAEVEALVAAGAVEVTLLGQNVNSYGVEFGDRGAFAKLLRACGAIEGLERVRFTSPHPAAFTDDVIEAMAETPNVMPSLHMPLQSGSDRVLRAMRRSYRSAKFLGILDRVRAAMPDAAITTDIIVGFPGETEEDFRETLRVVEASRFSSAFMFQYSPRPGTPAATMEEQLPKEVVQERFERLLELQERIAGEEADRQVGRRVEVLVAEGAGKKDGAAHRLSGRAPDNRLVHVALPADVLAGEDRTTGAPVSLDDPRLADRDALDPRLPRPGDVVTVDVTRAAPHHLIADSALDGSTYAVRRTRSGDAWAQRESARLGGGDDEHGHGGAAPAGGPVVLGMPSLRA